MVYVEGLHYLSALLLVGHSIVVCYALLQKSCVCKGHYVGPLYLERQRLCAPGVNRSK